MTVTVALLGVGADSTNSGPTPPVYQNQHFEYIPIPESRGREGTIEEKTYGNTDLRHQSGSIADYLEYIQPREQDSPEITGDELAQWPLHHDPNLDEFTYGETSGRSAYLSVLRNLNEGDVVAFYTGLKNKTHDYTHRYIIGYFTVDTIVDFQSLSEPTETQFSNLSEAKREAIMNDHKENAHAKRFFATGKITPGDGLVIVDGRDPGGRLDKTFRISKHRGGGHHYLTDELEEVFEPEQGGNPERNAYLGGIKKAHRLKIPSDEFIDFIESF